MFDLELQARCLTSCFRCCAAACWSKQARRRLLLTEQMLCTICCALAGSVDTGT